MAGYYDFDIVEIVLVAIRFYQYIGDKNADFLAEHNYSKEEVLEGLKRLAGSAGFGEVNQIFTEN